MKTSQKGIDLIKQFEGFQSKAYKCPAGVPTIGYGHTKTAKMGQIITQQEAENLLKTDLIEAENAVKSACIGININQNQFDALVSFVFNLGTKNFFSSALLKLIRKNTNDPAIRNEFSKWKHAGGKELPGLVKRRKAEAELYFN
jgi:lysozyme